MNRVRPEINANSGVISPRALKSTRRSVVFAVLGSFLLAGCVDEDRSFYIVQNQEPSETCTIGKTRDSLARFAGLLDVLGEQGYRLNPLVQSALTSRASGGEPERNVLHLRRFKVELDSDMIPLSDIDCSFSFPVAGTILPGGTLAFMGLPVILKQTVMRIKNNNFGYGVVVTANVQLVAERSGDEIESSVFPYPITLCKGCLIGKVLQSCNNVTSEMPKNACGIPQDEATTCCQDPDRGTICLKSETK